MAIACPYCRHRLSLKTAKPGKYTPKCPKCAGWFQVVVSDDPARAVLVSALENPQATMGPDAGAPAEPSATAVGLTASPLPVPKSGQEAGPKEVLATLGGYQVLKLLGRGGMGAVYLARQTSLDRLVAVKVMLPKAAANPDFVARFTREAYAAAQMVHHNVVQIYDIGSAKNTHYFSMEYVKGESLTDMVRREGKLDPERAVGYILQAARGLKYGHEMGIIHRDVKPDNLLINDQGIVKVADMGLVKLGDDLPPTLRRKGGGVDNPHPSSPARGESDIAPPPLRGGLGWGIVQPPALRWVRLPIMSPEQAANSSTVGPAADVYSLGCTLLLPADRQAAVRWPDGDGSADPTRAAPVVRPDAIDKRIPQALADILIKMLAKKPEDRYPDMGAVIPALESYLGAAHSGPFTPREEHATALEKSVRQFNAAPTVKLRFRIACGFAAGAGWLACYCYLNSAGRRWPAASSVY